MSDSEDDDAEWAFPVSTSPVRKRQSLPSDQHELRVMRVLAFHEAREQRARNERDRIESQKRDAANREAARVRAFQRKYNCDLAMFKKTNALREYVNRWDLPYSPGTLVHTTHRESELAHISTRKPDDNNSLARMQQFGKGAFLSRYDDVLGKPYELIYPSMPSIYTLQLLTAHVHIYSSQRSAGWFPHEQLPAWKRVFANSPGCRNEARQLLRALFLLAKKFGISMNGYAAFVNLVIRQLPRCEAITSTHLSLELAAMLPVKDIPIAMYSAAKRDQLPRHIRKGCSA